MFHHTNSVGGKLMVMSQWKKIFKYFKQKYVSRKLLLEVQFNKMTQADVNVDTKYFCIYDRSNLA